jgi:hypothetical protein
MFKSKTSVRNVMAKRIFALTVLVAAASHMACNSGVGVLPFGQISGVQLFDEPNFTMALSVEDAVSNPSAISKINWVFGDGSGFVEGAAGRTTISYRYNSPGNYTVIAYIFGTDGELANQITSAITVLSDDDDSNPPDNGDLPGQIRTPSPVDGASNVSVDTLLTWANGVNADSNDVYLGTNETDVEDATHSDSAIYRGNQEAADFDPDGLDPDTDYFWRVDSVNTAGVTKGVVRSFHTVAAPEKAKTPTPANGSVSARADQILTWVAGDNATSHDVYFGKNAGDVIAADTDTPDIFQGNQSGTTFNPSDEDAAVEGELLPATTYYWRIDEVGQGGTTTGDLFAFTVRPAPPAITSPVPADNAVNVSVEQILGWSASSSIENFDVYFGVDSIDVGDATRDSPEFMGNQTGKLFDPGDLAADFTYYWRVDTRGPGGTSEGVVLTFTTAESPAQVVGPFTPANNALNANIDQVLSWNAGVGGQTDSFEVYFSSVQSQVINGAAGALVTTQDVSFDSFDLTSLLDPATQYFWRVDAIGPGGRTAGQLLTFTTGALPGQAQNPNPLNNAIQVAPDAVLSWTAGVGSTSSDVYLGTDVTAVTNATESDASFRGNQAGTTFDVVAELGVPLNANTSYFWRIDAKSPGGPKKGQIWTFRTGPGRATNPNPQTASSDIPTTQQLSWTAGIGAVSHNVYFGLTSLAVTNANTLSAEFQGNQAATTFAPPTLQPLTQYFWRIDELASNGDTTKGTVWDFTTELGKATSPDPANLATGIALDATLGWTAPTGVTTFNVYFDTSLSAVTNATAQVSPPAGAPFLQTVSGTSVDPSVPPLTANTQYFWRVDSVSGATVRKGDVWRFTTLAPPGQAGGPTPTNGATNVPTSSSISWQPVSGATTYDVYFGTVNPPTGAQFQVNQAGTTFSPSLAAATTYFWRIDAKNGAGTTAGQVWSFTTP